MTARDKRRVRMWDGSKVHALLVRACQESGSQKAFAAKHNLSAQYVCDVVQNRREPGPKLLAALGLERVVMYRCVRGTFEMG